MEQNPQLLQKESDPKPRLSHPSPRKLTDDNNKK